MTVRSGNRGFSRTVPSHESGDVVSQMRGNRPDVSSSFVSTFHGSINIRDSQGGEAT